MNSEKMALEGRYFILFGNFLLAYSDYTERINEGAGTRMVSTYSRWMHEDELKILRLSMEGKKKQLFEIANKMIEQYNDHYYMMLYSQRVENIKTYQMAEVND